MTVPHSPALPRLLAWTSRRDSHPRPEPVPAPPARSVSPDVVIRASDSDAHVLALIQADTLDRDRRLVAQIRSRISRDE
jgi:hypothetical protein